MYKTHKILGLILARCGSKSIPKKNIKLLGGKPLIAHTIEKAKASKYPEFIDVLYKGTKGSKVENVLVEPLSQTKDFRGVFRIIGMGEE